MVMAQLTKGACGVAKPKGLQTGSLTALGGTSSPGANCEPPLTDILRSLQVQLPQPKRRRLRWQR